MEIYKEDVNGRQVFKCPFCDEEPQSSDIKFRKHLKIQHPTEKTLLKYSSNSKKTTEENVNFNEVELKDVEKLYKLVEQNSKSDHQADIYFNSTGSQIVDVKVGRSVNVDVRPNSTLLVGHQWQPYAGNRPGLCGRCSDP